MTERSPIMKTFDRFRLWSKEREVSTDAACITAAILTLAWVISDTFPNSLDRNVVKDSQEWLNTHLPDIGKG